MVEYSPRLAMSSTKVKCSMPSVFRTLLSVLGCLAVFAGDASSQERPNVIVVLADDLGYSDLGCYGGEISTPNIDALAADGVKLSQVYNSARCCPSRASLMTGLYPTQAGIGDFTTREPNRTRGQGYLGRLRDDCVTMAEVLKPEGYGCYYVGKWHMHPKTGPIKRGFDEFYGYTNDHSHDQYDADYYIRLPENRVKEIDPPADQFYATDVFNDYAIEFIRQGQSTNKPWFLFLGHSSPHFPVQAPSERADKYEPIYSRGWDVLRDERFERMRELGLVDGDHWKMAPREIVPVDRDDIANGFAGEQNPAWDSLKTDRQKDLARRMSVFAAMVEGVDRGVGQIVEHLKDTGDLENTLILFLSDNGACYEWGPFGFDGVSRRGETILRTGEQLREIGGRGTHQSYGSAWANLGNTPFRMYKHFTHEGGISTPFIAHWPKGIAKRNDWVREPAHMMDVLPTVLEAAGGEYPTSFAGHSIQPLEGKSLLPVMRGETSAVREIGFDHQAAHALREGDWKIVYSKRMPEKLTWELYNLAEDRCELNNLADQHPQRLASMVSRWEAWAKRVGVTWEPYEGTEKATSATEETESPLIANRTLTLTVEIEADNPSGVAMAQGGIQHGYALHFVDGKPAFDVRVDGKVKRLMGTATVRGRVQLAATLSAKRMTLTIDGGEPISTSSPGLIPAQPVDGLSIGFDERTAAGDYSSPNRFSGKVLHHNVEAIRPAVGGPAKKKSGAASDGKSKPNFVFVLTDDISPDDLSVYGNAFVPTPNLERLASKGLVFDNAYLTISSCSPSRCSMITGRYPHNTGAPELHTTLPETQRTFVQSLRDAGYHTVISGKNHMADPHALGFDVSTDSKPAGSERWVSHLRDRPTDQPFFCWFASHDAHSPFTPNEDAPKFDAKSIGVPPMLFDGEGTRDQLAGYYHEVARTDHAVGQVLEELKRQKILDNTYIIYCSDNGRPFPRCKTYLYDSGIKTPLIISGPNVVNGRTNSIVSSIDFAPTILELAGVACPKTVQGVSAVDVLGDPNAITREVAFAERNWHVFQNHERAVRAGDWLYIWNAWPERHNLSGESASYSFAAARELWEAAKAGKLTDAQALLTQKPQPAEMLFHVGNDPNQFVNLASMPEHQTTLQQMRVLLDQWKEETGDSVPKHPTADRQPLHASGGSGNMKRGEFPGSDNNCTTINASGPIMLPRQASTLSANVSKPQNSDMKVAMADDTESRKANIDESKADQFPNSAFVEVPTDQVPGPVMDAETIRAGLQSHDRALFIKAGWIRDPYVTSGPDGYFYLTGTQPNEGDPREQSNPYNIGLGDQSIVGSQVRAYRSKDLVEWESLGVIFDTDDTWKAMQGRRAAKDRIWAPEVHWMPNLGNRGRWALVHCPKQHSSFVLSKDDKLSGPWTHPMKGKMGPRHDPSLFTDDDGTVWMLWQNTSVAPLTKDLSGYAAQPVRIDPSGTRPGPDGTPIRRIGHEGATMIKVGGQYVHLGTAWSTDQGRKGSYNLYYSVADKITGPYGPRKFAGRFLGHGTPFQTQDGKWWCTAFFNANVPPVQRDGIEGRDLSDNAQTINEQGVTIVPLEVRMTDDGEVLIRAKDPAYANPGPDESQKF